MALWTFMFIMLGFNNFTPSLFNLPIFYLSISNPSLSYDYKCFSSKKINKILSFSLSACCGKWDRNESKNVSISKLIIGTKPKRFDLVRLLSEQKQKVSICSKIISNRIGTFWRFLKFKNETRTNRANFLSDQNVSIQLCFKGNKTELLWTISKFFY